MCSRTLFESILICCSLLALTIALDYDQSSRFGVTAPVLSLSFSNIQNGDLVTARKIRDELTTSGIIQIKHIPDYADARTAALKNLAECLRDGKQSPIDMVMSDGSKRASLGASSPSGISGGFSGSCGEASSRVRKAVDDGTREVLQALDRLVAAQGSDAEVMSPVKTYDQLRLKGEHLEHLHAYYAPEAGHTNAPVQQQGSAASQILTSEISSVNRVAQMGAPPTMDFHTDGGLFIAMTAGFYTSCTYTAEDAGLYIKLADGSVARANIDDDALVIMVGEAGARWLSPKLGSALRAVPHAMVAGLSSEGCTRAWYGKMFMPPADALVPLVSNASGKKMTYADYRRVEQDVLARRASSGAAAGLKLQAGSATAGSRSSSDLLIDDSDLLPTACGRSTLDLVSASLQSSSTACTTRDGKSGAMCWAQCYSLEGLGCSIEEAQCVDTSNNNKPVDGNHMCPGKPMGSACKLMCPAAQPSYGPTYYPTQTPTASSGGDPGDDAPTDPSGGSPSDEHHHHHGGQHGVVAAPFCYGSGTTMVMDGFVSTVMSGRGKSPCINYLFPSWTLDTPFKFVIACLGTVALGVLIGFITKLRFRVSKLPLSRYQLRNSLTVTLFALNIGLGYAAMLIAMTYNTELFLMMVGGLTLGHALFNLDIPQPESTDPCCAAGEVAADLSVSGHHLDSDAPTDVRTTSFTKRTGYQMLPGNGTSGSQLVGAAAVQQRRSPPSKPACCGGGAGDP